MTEQEVSTEGIERVFRNVGRKSDFILINQAKKKSEEWVSDQLVLYCWEMEKDKDQEFTNAICKQDIMSTWPMLFGWSGVEIGLMEMGWGKRMRSEEMENLENRLVLWWALLNERTRKWVEIN